MKCEILDVNSFKSLFNSIADIFGEVTFTCDSEGIRFGGLDKSHVMFMHVNLDNDYFIEYECPEPDRFTLDVNELKKCLKSCKNDLTLEHVGNKINLSSQSKVFSLFEHEIDYADNPTPPNVLYDYKVEIPISFLKETVKDIQLFSQDVIIKTSEYDFTLSCEGTTGEYSNKYTCDKSLEETSAKFSAEKINTLLGADKVADHMIIKGKSDNPLTVELENIGISLKYLVAPKIEVD